MNDFIYNDLLGKKCNICTGEYTKMGLDDDLCGCVTCCECGNRVNRYIVTNLRPDHHPEPCEKKESEETLTAKIDVLTEVIERIEKFEMPEQPLQERSDYYRDIVGNMLADCKRKLY
jgi:hypothetical protein